MSLELRRRLFDELDALTLIDPHTHIDPYAPAAQSLADILGYHYYTELAHSAGMPKAQIEESDLPPDEKVRRLIENLQPIGNTIQYSWLTEMCRELFSFEEEISPANWRSLYDAAASRMSQADWPAQVLAKSKLEAVFLTNDFDDSLEGFDTAVYVPCLRTDDLVFHLARPEVRNRLERATGTAAGDARGVRRAIAHLFRHFKAHNARACAISLPPDFSPLRVSPARANTALAAIQSDGLAAAESHRRAAANFVFWTIAEIADAFHLPFDLMIGVNRGVYESGVHQGRDLFDSRVSLVQYKALFNAFPGVTFPISVLASATNQELTSYAWIFPNVVTSGHWWYSNTPTFIEHDLAARLEAVPRNKQIGYYSDMYKLEFALPKFAMYKRILAKVLAERFVIDRGWSEQQALALGAEVLRGNVERVFRWGEDTSGQLPDESELDPLPSSAAAFAAPVTAPVVEGTSLFPREEDGATPLGTSPLTQSAFGSSVLNTPAGPLRAPDEELTIPVPEDAFQPEELASPGESGGPEEAAPPLELTAEELTLDENALDLEEELSASASAAGIGAVGALSSEPPDEPPSLELVEEMEQTKSQDSPFAFLDQPAASTPAADESAEELPPLSLEALEAEPPPKDNKKNQDQWGFLGGK
jgi:glucuronate isomerase